MGMTFPRLPLPLLCPYALCSRILSTRAYVLTATSFFSYHRNKNALFRGHPCRVEELTHGVRQLKQPRPSLFER